MIEIVRAIKLSLLTGKELTGLALEVKTHYDNLFSKTIQYQRIGYKDFIFYKTKGTNYLAINLKDNRIDFNISYFLYVSFKSFKEVEYLTKCIMEIYLLSELNNTTGLNLSNFNDYIIYFSSKLSIEDLNRGITNSKKLKII